MTREEAIKIIKNMINSWQKDYAEEVIMATEEIQALNMAVKALEQETKFIIKSDGSIEQIINKDVNDILDTIKSVIKHQEYWLLSAGYSMLNVDLAFDTIREVIEGLRHEKIL